MGSSLPRATRARPVRSSSGSRGGRVYSFDAVRGVVRCLTEERMPIVSMAVDAEGQTLVLVIGEGPGPRWLVHLDRFHSSTSGWSRQARMMEGPGDFWLTPVMSDGSVRALGIWNSEDKEMVLMGGIGDLSVWLRLPMPFLKNRTIHRDPDPADRWQAVHASSGPGPRRAGPLPGRVVGEDDPPTLAGLAAHPTRRAHAPLSAIGPGSRSIPSGSSSPGWIVRGSSTGHPSRLTTPN